MNGISKDKGVIYYFNKLMLTCIKKKTQQFCFVKMVIVHFSLIFRNDAYKNSQ